MDSKGPPPYFLLLLADAAREGDPLLRGLPVDFSAGPTSVPLDFPSRQEALLAAFHMLGWDHEIGLFAKLNPGASFRTFANSMNPSPPVQFLEEPGVPLGNTDLKSLLEWVRSCRKSMSWEFAFEGSFSTLRVHREGIAAVGGFWEILLEEGLPENLALEKLAGFSNPAYEAALRRRPDGFFDLISGPWPTFVKARETYSQLPPTPGMRLVLSPESPGQAPLFWAALIMHKTEKMPGIRFARELGMERQTLSAIAGACGAEAGINGGFFSSLGPVGTLALGGTVLHQSYGDRSALGLTPGQEPLFGNGSLSLSVETGGRVFSLDKLNELPRDGEVALILDLGNYPVPVIPPAAGYLSLPLMANIRSRFSDMQAGGFLVCRENSGTWLPSPGEELPVHLSANWADERFADRQFVLQAGPLILSEGIENGASESFDEKTRLQRHPRSLVGWDGTSLWWIVVDGRDPSHSQGLTLHETASLALSLGLRDALNLDGGGSSALWWKGSLVNLPPGGKERPLPYAILFGIPGE